MRGWYDRYDDLPEEKPRRAFVGGRWIYEDESHEDLPGIEIRPARRNAVGSTTPDHSRTQGDKPLVDGGSHDPSSSSG